MKIKETGDGKWIVAVQYDGYCLAGPFDAKGEAFEAMDGLTPAVVRMVASGGFEVRNEDTNALLGGPYRNRQMADRECLQLRQPAENVEETPRRGRPPKPKDDE